MLTYKLCLIFNSQFSTFNLIPAPAKQTNNMQEKEDKCKCCDTPNRAAVRLSRAVRILPSTEEAHGASGRRIGHSTTPVVAGGATGAQRTIAAEAATGSRQE